MKDTKQLVITDYTDPHIAHLKMQDVEGKNSLSHAFVTQLEEQLAEIKDNDEVKVVLISGLSDVFCAGADLKTLRQLGGGKLKPVDILLSKTLLDLPVPVIAAVEGHAVGGGLAIATCADMVVLAEESRYGCSFMNMGFTPGMGITKLMEHYMSPAIAHEMQYSGSFIKGRDLKGKTNFNYILPKKEVLLKALYLAEGIAEKSNHALRVLKRYLSMSRRKLFEETYSIESMMHELTFNSEDITKQIEDNYVR